MLCCWTCGGKVRVEVQACLRTSRMGEVVAIGLRMLPSCVCPTASLSAGFFEQMGELVWKTIFIVRA